MTFSGHNPQLFRWKRVGSANKKQMPMRNDDIDQWRKRVEMASEFAVTEVFSHKRAHSGVSSLAVPLQSSEQLRDHDSAYSEAQALLGDWLNSKLRLELEMDDEDALMSSAETRQPTAQASSQPNVFNHSTFDDLYSHLAEEEEHTAVNGFLQDLMKHEVLDSGIMEELALDDRESRKRCRDPVVTMEARHQQVRENRARREADRQRQQREKEAQRDARTEAKRREREEEIRKNQKERRQEELMQQEMVRLRRQMERRRGLEQPVRQRERENLEVQRAAGSLQSTPTPLTKQPPLNVERLQREHKIQTKVQLNRLQCLQRHFSGWHSAMLDRRLHMNKAIALSTWRRQLRAWRAWRAVVWAQRTQREVARAEAALRMEKRQHQLAVKSDQRRLLQRCLNEWQLWCRLEKEQRELLARQQETKCKMAALLNAASTGKLTATETPADQSKRVPPEPPNQSETMVKRLSHRLRTIAPGNCTVKPAKTSVRTVPRPFEPWKVTRRLTVPSAAELCEARQRVEVEDRPTIQQQIIAQQRRLLQEQQEQIARLKEKQNLMDLQPEMEKPAQLSEVPVTGGTRTKSHSLNTMEQRAQGFAEEPGSQSAPLKKATQQQTSLHPIIKAMEARAKQRAERRKEIEELKRKKENIKLAEMKAAEEQRQREEEEEKCKAAEKRREEKRLEREREEEKQRQLRRQQELMRLARQHYRRTLLLRQGLAPWKRLIQLRQTNMELAENHHNLFLLRRCVLRWQQSARESLYEKEALADQLYQHILLRRSLNCWKRLRDMWMIQEERAERFYRKRTLRKFLLALLHHVTQERLVDWERQGLAVEHNNRRVVQRCFLAWRQLPCVLRRERERDGRREKLSRKVAEVLPDFCSHVL
ncbi:coiled-coil domain-containing protein 191 [Menidia menidia]